MTDSDNYSSSRAIILQGPTNPSHKKLLYGTRMGVDFIELF